MIAEGHSVAALHGAKDANERDLVIDGFRDGNTKVLITTNVIARGIDISQVTMVVNYDLPTLRQGGMGRDRVDTETYLHRVGQSRTTSCCQGESRSPRTLIESRYCVLLRSNGSIRTTRNRGQLCQR
jgi:superfamily II DNA/RNA helicase